MWEKLKEKKYLYPYAEAYIDAYDSVFRKYDREYEDALLNLYKRVGLLPEDSSEDIDIKEMIKNRHN